MNFKKNYFYLLISMIFSINSNQQNNLELKEIKCTFQPVFRLSKGYKDAMQAFTHPFIPFTDILKNRSVKNSQSTNWSGYVSVNNLVNPKIGSISKVKGNWTVPTIQQTANNGFCAIWVGIDGYHSPTVEQIGTEHDWYNNAQQHYAWFEMYPGPSYEIKGFPVQPGDQINTSVKYAGNNIFKLTIKNLTKKVFTVIPTNYTTKANTKRNSAEWIVEAPFLQKVLPLSNFGTIHLTNCSAVVNGIECNIVNNSISKAIAIDMASNTTKALTSVVTNQKDFHVTWKHQ